MEKSQHLLPVVAPEGEEREALVGLLGRATAGEAEARKEATARLMKRLERGGGQGGAEAARELGKLLEDPRLEGLEDAHGVTLRARAVGALLALGFPHALGVRWEDLEHYRTQMRSRRWPQRLSAGLLGLLVAAQLGVVGVGHALAGEGRAELLVAHGALTALAAAGTVWGRGRRRRRIWLALLLGLGVAFGAALGLRDAPVALGTAAAALALALSSWKGATGSEGSAREG